MTENQYSSNFFQRYLNRSEVVLGIFFGIVFAFIVNESAFLAVGVMGAFAVSLVFSKRPIEALSLFILIMPLSQLPIFSDPLVNLPGARPVLLLGGFVTIIAIMNSHLASRLPRYAFFIMVLVLASFTIAVFEAVGYLDVLNDLRGRKETPVQFLLSSWLKQCLYFIPFILICKFVRTREQLLQMIRIVIYSVMILTIYFLYYYIFKVADKGNFTAAWEYSATALGLHKNAAATFYCIIFPFLLARYFEKPSIFAIGSIVASVGTIAFLYSRTAYVTLVFSVLMYMVISKRTRYLPIVLTLGAIGLTIVGASVLQHSMKGIDEDGVDLHAVTSGRIDRLWLPLIDEYSTSPRWMLFGKGRMAILTTSASADGEILGAAHPHNMFLELVLDIGLVGFAFYMIYFFFFFKFIWKARKRIRDPVLREYHYAIIVGITSYMAAGFTGRTFFPDMESSYFWIIMGITVVLLRVASQPEETKNELA